MFFFVALSFMEGWSDPLDQLNAGADFLFPRISLKRGANMRHESAQWVSGPAATSAVVKAMRWLLTLPPLSLSVSQVARDSGHSLRHLVPTIARIFGFPEEDRFELNRWAIGVDRQRGGQGNMPQVYSQEAAEHRVVPILSRLLAQIGARAEELGGIVDPLRLHDWAVFRSDASRYVPPDNIEAEASSSESDED